MSAEYSAVYIGESSRGCGRPATVRLYKEWVVCALHYAEFLVTERVNEANLALDIIGPFRSEAEFHNCGNLVAALDRIAEDERARQAAAREEMEAFRRIAHESTPEHDASMRVVKREPERGGP